MSDKHTICLILGIGISVLAFVVSTVTANTLSKYYITKEVNAGLYKALVVTSVLSALATVALAWLCLKKENKEYHTAATWIAVAVGTIFCIVSGLSATTLKKYEMMSNGQVKVGFVPLAFSSVISGIGLLLIIGFAMKGNGKGFTSPNDLFKQGSRRSLLSQ